MLDMSFSEIAVIGAVALVVLGPERLPKVARTAGQLFGRVQRYVATVKADINREMETSELAKIKQEVQDAAKSFEQTVQQSANSVEKEASAISQSVDLQPTTSETVVLPPTTQSAMLEQQESGLPGDAVAVIDAKPPAALTTVIQDGARARPEHPVQASLDFGIEPVRVSKSV